MDDLEALLTTRTHQVEIMQRFLVRLAEALQTIRLIATDEQRTVIDEALARVPGPFRG